MENKFLYPPKGKTLGFVPALLQKQCTELVYKYQLSKNIRFSLCVSPPPLQKPIYSVLNWLKTGFFRNK